MGSSYERRREGDRERGVYQLNSLNVLFIGVSDKAMQEKAAQQQHASLQKEEAERKQKEVEAGTKAKEDADRKAAEAAAGKAAGGWGLNDVVQVHGRNETVSLDMRPGHNYIKVKWSDTQTESEVICADQVKSGKL